MSQSPATARLEIFVPFWGDPGLLRQTTESVLEQRNSDWHLTVVDDAYPDDSVAAYFSKMTDPRVTYVRNDANLGITHNYRACLSRATADLVVLLGCDDLLHPNYVDVILDAHAACPEAAIIQPGVDIVDEHGQRVSTRADRVKRRLTPGGTGRHLLGGEDLARDLLRANWLYWPSLAFRTDRVTKFDFREGFPIIQDLALIMDMVYDGETLLYDPTPCFSYRRHTASASSATLMDGTRFSGERAYFAIAARQATAIGWKRASRAARLHLTSRAHALALIPEAIRARHRSAVGQLMRHAFSR